jgi:hypothetical protein
MKNFGEIKNIFFEVLTEGIIRKDDAYKKLFKKFLKTIKENKTLKTQYDVYANIEGKVDTDTNNASLYVEENIKLLQSLGGEEILKANTDLMKLVEGLIDDVPVNYPEDKKELHESITNLLFTKKNPKTIDSIVESKVKLVSHILNNTIEEKTVSEDIIPNSVLSSLYVNKFNAKYSDLNEGDKSLFKALLETDVEKQANLYTELVKECVALVNENLEGSKSSTKETLLSVKEKLLRLEYNQETFAIDVEKIATLKSTLA